MVRSAVIASCILALAASSAAAQPAYPPPERPLQISAELGVVVPLGDWADFSGVGFGPLVRLTHRINPRLSFLARAGYIFHTATTQAVLGTQFDVSTTELVITGGVRYEVAPAIHVGATTGLNVWGVKISSGGQSDSDSENRVPLMLDVTYATTGGVILGGGLFVPNLLSRDDDEDVVSGLMLNAGFTFMK